MHTHTPRCHQCASSRRRSPSATSPTEAPGQLPIGITGDHRAVVLNLEGADPHLMVFGDNESGKSATLRLLIQQATRGRTGDQVAIAAIDYRRAHMDDISESHVVGYATTNENASKLAQELHGELSKRLPPADLPRQRLVDRDWWRGPELYVVVDDYELVATQAGNPLSPLAPLLPYARDIGLHLIVARRMGGAARAIFDPILQPLIELGTPTLLHSGDRAEGRFIHSTAPQFLPPGRALYVARGRIAVPVQIAMP
ncbi:FtsK/SpoIIIE domain-containing protein [Nocardioides sp. DS6]|uniref:FtsK/SpoIIIE domain-containing protein n=1 Tax=Nocardioides eburneus TaxID=3231482 RepID=A0ABV3T0B4_9ACTN